MINLSDDLKKVKDASYKILNLDTSVKNEILEKIAIAIENKKDEIIKENNLDLKIAKENNIKESFIDRLTLNSKRIDDLAISIRSLISLKDPSSEVISSWCANGLNISKKRVPFGVICVVYEARPNVTVDISAMAIKTSNACILRGGKEAINTNKCLVKIIKEVLKEYDLENCVYLVSDLDRNIVDYLVRERKYIDLIIPRGGKGLIDRIVSIATVPVIETGAGTCHMYVNEYADFSMALKLIENAKVQRPSVCNSIECVLVDEKIKSSFLPLLKNKMEELNVEIRADKEVSNIIKCTSIEEDDYYKEYNDLILNVKVVEDYIEAINHINKYSTHHSDCIITGDEKIAKVFLSLVDSACVYHNASTRFTDGGCFGFGAEVGISTQKLHARGPMGLFELTSYKYIIEGNGEVRK